MKKLLLSAAAAVIAMSASAIDAEKVWNFGEMFTADKIEAHVAAGNIKVGDDGKGNVSYDFAKQFTEDGLTFYSKYVEGADKQALWSLQNGTGASLDGTLSFTMVLKSGGISSWVGQPTEEDPAGLPASQWVPDTRMMSFEVDGPTDIILYYVSANSSASDRYTRLYAGSAENDLGETLASSAASGIYPWHYRYTGEATTIYVYVNGVNFYGIKLTPATEQPEQVEVYTNIELCDGEMNPNGLASDEMGKITMNPAKPTGGYEVGTEVTFNFTGANDFALDHWEVNGEVYDTNKSLKITITPETTDVYAMVKYVDPLNAAPGYLDANTVKSGSVRNWATESSKRKVCCIPLSSGITTPEKSDFTNYYWPDAERCEAIDFPALSGAKGTQTWDFQMRAQAGVDNVIVACANKQGGEGSIHVTVYKGEEQGADEDIVADGVAVLPITFQDWNYMEVKVPFDEAIKEAGVYYIQIQVTSGDSGRAPQMLYAVTGIGDNYGGWYDTDPRNPANLDAIDDILVDEVNAPVRYFNLQGIEVSADTKGLIILSNGTKKLNK